MFDEGEIIVGLLKRADGVKEGRLKVTEGEEGDITREKYSLASACPPRAAIICFNSWCTQMSGQARSDL